MKKNSSLTKTLFTLLALVTFSNFAFSQRHSGLAFNVGVKKNSFSLKDNAGIKMNDFTGSLAPYIGLSYSHILASKFNATYEFGFSHLKGTYNEQFDPNYSTPYSTSNDNSKATSQALIKTLAYSLQLLGHYQVTRKIFISAGISFERYLNPAFTVSDIDENYANDLVSDASAGIYNISGLIGVGYTNENFRIDLRHGIGLNNLIAQPTRYEKLNLSQTSLIFGYYIGKK
jgi:hypothetical protein